MAKPISEVLHVLVDEIDEGHGRNKGELHDAIREHFNESTEEGSEAEGEGSPAGED